MMMTGHATTAGSDKPQLREGDRSCDDQGSHAFARYADDCMRSTSWTFHAH